MYELMPGTRSGHGSGRVTGRAGWLPAIWCCVFWLALSGRSALAGQPDPRAMLQEMTDRVLAEIRQDPTLVQDDARVRALADRYILPHIDFNASSQWVLGKYWRTATEQQRNRFVQEFRALLLNTYLRSINKYSDNVIHILPSRATPQDDRAEVEAEVEQPGGLPIHVSFRLHLQSGAWLIYDISVEGISLVTTNRSAFAREISVQGLDALIVRLAKMNAAEPAAPTRVAAPATPAR
jgi:phospholipid transport system substrate-binding protein